MSPFLSPRAWVVSLPWPCRQSTAVKSKKILTYDVSRDLYTKRGAILKKKSRNVLKASASKLSVSQTQKKLLIVI
jgi:hypothetical protein